MKVKLLAISIAAMVHLNIRGQSCEIARSFKGHQESILAIVQSPDGKHLLSANTPRAPDWQMGRAWETDEIRMVSHSIAKASHDFPFSNDIPVHELGHCIHWAKIGNTRNIP